MDIQNLNTNLNIVREAGETDENFLRRLQTYSEENMSEGELEEAIKRKEFLRTKDNLKTLINDSPKTEAITKLLSTKEQSEYNKLEQIINKKFLEVYGYNNSRISEQDVVDFIKSMLTQDPFNLVSLKAETTAKKLIEEPEQPKISDTNKEQGRIILRKYLEDELKKPPHNMLLSKSVTSIDALLVAYYDHKILIPEEIILKLHGEAKQNQARKLNEKMLKKITTEESPPDPNISFGVGVKDYPKLIKFGKIYISADELYYKNILKIRNIHKKGIIGIPNIKVSEELASILLKIIDGEKVNRNNLNLLSSNERHIYDQVLIMSGLHKTLDNTFDTTAQELKEKLQVVEGEIMAGNNNPELLKEVHHILWTMNSVGLLSGSVASKRYKDIKDEFF